jgi:hypothetical protein
LGAATLVQAVERSMKRKPDDKQRTISSFFASAPANKPKSKPLAQLQQHQQGATAAETSQAAAAPPHAKRHKPSTHKDDELDVIEILDGDDVAAQTAPEAAAASTARKAGTAGATRKPCAGNCIDISAPAAIPDVRNHARHSKAQAKLVGAPGAASLAEPGAPAAAAAATAVPAGGSSSSRRQQQQQQPKYTPLEQQVVALKAAHPGVSLLLCMVSV